jgi:hypothetical protein
MTNRVAFYVNRRSKVAECYVLLSHLRNILSKWSGGMARTDANFPGLDTVVALQCAANLPLCASPICVPPEGLIP